MAKQIKQSEIGETEEIDRLREELQAKDRLIAQLLAAQQRQ